MTTANRDKQCPDLLDMRASSVETSRNRRRFLFSKESVPGCPALLRGCVVLVDLVNVPYQRCKSYSTSNRAKCSADRCKGLATGEQASDGWGKEQCLADPSRGQELGCCRHFISF